MCMIDEQYKVISSFTAYSYYCIDCHYQWMTKVDEKTACLDCGSENTVGSPSKQEIVVDEVEMQKNEWAREEAKRINNGGEPGKYTPEMFNKIKENLK